MESFEELFTAYICLCLALIANVCYYEYTYRDFWKMQIGVLVFDVILVFVLFAGGGIVG